MLTDQGNIFAKNKDPLQQNNETFIGLYSRRSDWSTYMYTLHVESPLAYMSSSTMTNLLPGTVLSYLHTTTGQNDKISVPTYVFPLNTSHSSYNHHNLKIHLHRTSDTEVAHRNAQSCQVDTARKREISLFVPPKSGRFCDIVHAV